MPLFQTSVLNKYLAALDKEIIDKQYALFKTYFLNATIQKNIIASKEEEFQEGFLRELLVKILGYTINPEPQYNLRTEQKNIKDSKKADGAIVDGENVLAVIELKGTNTPNLNTIEIQAFNYKNNQVNCRYVITSNFQKLRFYIDNAIDYLEWDLFKLDIEAFKQLYLCLHKENIFKDLPATIKQESITEEENVTKKLYKEYSAFRKTLFNNIVEQNPETDKLLLFKKTQKLLDRFLFLFFAEDRLLVPPNSVRLILNQWTDLKEQFDEYQPLYDRFKKYFGYLNTGYTGKTHEIFAYNGGLFATDKVLDTIKINDTILYDGTLNLSRYDYNSDVDVNILGHIFEHSLTEIEELEQAITDTTTDSTKTTKRKKDGVFYTPKYITKYIVENTVGTLCKNKPSELKIEDEDYHPLQKKKTARQLLDNLSTYREWLLQITIVDPACGSGAFLNQALEFLIAEHKSVAELEANITGSAIVFDVENSILENNLFGVDINEESVEIAKLSLWLRTARKGRKLSALNNNIKCGNSLIDDETVAGNKAFNWQKEFPKIFEKGGFDVVIGNPPYVRQELLSDFKDYFSKEYKVFNYSSDIFAYFYEKAFSVLKEEGAFSFISNTFDKTAAGISLREYLKKNVTFIKLIDFTQIQIFEGATTYPIILIAKKSTPKLQTNNFSFIKIPNIANPKSLDIDLYNSNIIFQDSLDDTNWKFNSSIGNNILNKITNYKTIRSQFGKCYRGIVTGFNEAFIITSHEREMIIKISPLDNEIIKPFYEGSDLEKWNTSQCDKFILFTRRGINIDNYPGVKSWLEQYKQKLEPRNDSGQTIGRKPGPYKWFEIQDSVDYYKLFEDKKIVWPNLQNSNKFSYESNGVYINAPSVIFPSSNKALLSIINSKLIWYFLNSICVVRNGGYIEVKPQYFEQIPIPELNKEFEIELSAKSEKNIIETKNLQEINFKFQKLLQSKFSTLNINTKLEKWFTLSFADFSKELSKQKIKLSLQEQSEWLGFFEQQKQQALAIKNEIDTTDAAIDKMVYALYGLTEDEIKIVEGNS